MQEKQPLLVRNFSKSTLKLGDYNAFLTNIINYSNNPRQILNRTQSFNLCPDQRIKNQFKQSLERICVQLNRQGNYIKQIKKAVGIELAMKNNILTFDLFQQRKKWQTQIKEIIEILGKILKSDEKLFFDKIKTFLSHNLVRNLINVNRDSIKYNFLIEGLKKFDKNSNKKLIQLMGQIAITQFESQQLKIFNDLQSRVNSKNGLFVFNSPSYSESRQLSLIQNTINQIQKAQRYEDVQNICNRKVKQTQNKQFFVKFIGVQKSNFRMNAYLQKIKNQLSLTNGNMTPLVSQIDFDVILKRKTKNSLMEITTRLQTLQRCQNIFKQFFMQMNEQNVRKIFDYLMSLSYLMRKIMFQIDQDAQKQKYPSLYSQFITGVKSKKFQIFALMTYLQKIVCYFMINIQKLKSNKGGSYQSINLDYQLNLSTNKASLVPQIQLQIIRNQQIREALDLKNNLMKKLQQQLQAKNNQIGKLQQQIIKLQKNIEYYQQERKQRIQRNQKYKNKKRDKLSSPMINTENEFYRNGQRVPDLELDQDVDMHSLLQTPSYSSNSDYHNKSNKVFYRNEHRVQVQKQQQSQKLSRKQSENNISIPRKHIQNISQQIKNKILKLETQVAEKNKQLKAQSELIQQHEDIILILKQQQKQKNEIIENMKIRCHQVIGINKKIGLECDGLKLDIKTIEKDKNRYHQENKSLKIRLADLESELNDIKKEVFGQDYNQQEQQNENDDSMSDNVNQDKQDRQILGAQVHQSYKQYQDRHILQQKGEQQQVYRQKDKVSIGRGNSFKEQQRGQVQKQEKTSPQRQPQNQKQDPKPQQKHQSESTGNSNLG